MNSRIADVTNALASVKKSCQRENRVVFDEEGSYIENKASGRKVPMRVENGVHVIDVHVKNLIDTGGLVFVRASEGNEPACKTVSRSGRIRMRPVSADTKKGAAKSRVRAMMRARSIVMTRKRRPEQPSQRETLVHRRQRRSPSMPCHIGHIVARVPHCVKGRGRSRQHRTIKSSERTLPVLSGDYCFIGGGITDHESPVLIMVDTETGMVFAHVCKRKGDPDILEN